MPATHTPVREPTFRLVSVFIPLIPHVPNLLPCPSFDTLRIQIASRVHGQIIGRRAVFSESGLSNRERPFKIQSDYRNPTSDTF